MFKRISGLMILAVLVLGLSVAARAETFYAYLNGAQQVPVAATTATGYARVFIDEGAGTLSFTVVFNGLTSAQTASHIHAPAAIGVNAAVAINFGVVGGTSGTISGSTTITPMQLSQIRAHLGYVNVHSTNFPGGEIRGQLGIKRPVDFDGDGRQDFSVLRFPSTGGVLPITYWNLNTTSGTQIGQQWGDAARDYPAPGDYDGDGKDDFALYRAGATAGAQGEFWILTSNNTIKYYAWGLNGDQPVARDYDGDGKTDVGIFRPGSSVGTVATWYILRSSNNTLQIEAFGTTGDGTNNFDTPVPGDYDGDGKFDLAVYRFAIAPANNFIVKRSSDGVIIYQPWGNFNTDYILPGDYDGDGKFDFCAGRTGAASSSPMVWWILQSSNGATRVQQWGISSDLPVQGDYDGDARTDIAIYRPGATTGSVNNFWVLNSFDNTTLTRQWGVRGDFAIAQFDAR